MTYWKEILIGVFALVAGWWLRSRPTGRKEIIKAQESVRKALDEAEQAAKAEAQKHHNEKDEQAEDNRAEIVRADRTALSALINRVFGGPK